MTNGFVTSGGRQVCIQKMLRKEGEGRELATTDSHTVGLSRTHLITVVWRPCSIILAGFIVGAKDSVGGAVRDEVSVTRVANVSEGAVEELDSCGDAIMVPDLDAASARSAVVDRRNVESDHRRVDTDQTIAAFVDIVGQVELLVVDARGGHVVAAKE